MPSSLQDSALANGLWSQYASKSVETILEPSFANRLPTIPHPALTNGLPTILPLPFRLAALSRRRSGRGEGRGEGCIFASEVHGEGSFSGQRSGVQFAKKFSLATTSLPCGLILLLALLGCRTPPPIPQVNLTEPGWNVRHGQAIWRPQRDAPEIAGELLVATHTNQSALVQFIKSPFPMVDAQQTPTSWRIEFAGGNKKYGGPGKPPRRLLWFWLLPALSGESLPKNWLWHENQNRWHLENSVTGEFLEGYFQPPATFLPAPQIFPGASRKLSMNRTNSTRSWSAAARNELPLWQTKVPLCQIGFMISTRVTTSSPRIRSADFQSATGPHPAGRCDARKLVFSSTI